ncbi:RNA 2',3'-cyclic phosphodiesterase [Candidatus Pacearchaeota archaeon]|nr:RNA 2',3'-cyclic phosphodiesterase [Candidatus Pacearchaeota archaeon]
MRVFIAIDLPEHVKAKIFHEFENLRTKNLFNGKFVEKDNLHLTLKFLGEINEEKIEEIKSKLKELKFEKFDCEIGKTGFFHDKNHIKVIWVELVSEKIKELQQQIDRLFPEILVDKEFSFHITTARVKFVEYRENLVKEVEKIHFKNLDFEVDEFVLIKSELMRQGPVYKILQKCSLVK